MKTMDWLYILCRWTLGVLFIYAGTAKLLDPLVFAVLIEAYGIVPRMLLMPVAVALPLLEVIAGIGLLLETRGSLALITGLLLVFMAILAYAIGMGLDVDCGCFGPDDPEAEAFHGLRLAFFRDLAMMAGVVFMYGWRRYRRLEPLGIMDSVTQVTQLLSKRRNKDAYR
ncbi:MAG: MauE/DoxX family redox-associated membrane protein [Desulfopila sp.]|jgi:uncharacterized membrane protein YphA (DoxX/SURF4 family)|nr:MauE/DoxX family redox-associated membrane protein [Desulfopila sp.]